MAQEQMSDVTKNYAQIVHGQYQPYIDGLRALAVLPVVLFHLLPLGCPGGFLGVDVFFVISGYLITGGILRDLQKERFTISNFYYRRIRRIFPAYFALIAGVFVAGCALYCSDRLLNLANTAVMGTLFSANLYFFKFSGGYFDPCIHDNPLMHLWSLSVEEQFYLVVPVLCAFFWQKKRGLLFPVLVALCCVSLAWSTVALLNGLKKDAFFLLQFRAWELLVGSVLAVLVVHRDTEGAQNNAGKGLATIGVVALLASYWVVTAKALFPGITALPSVLATALIIRYGGMGWVGKMLSWTPLVGVGRISYSLYLWHWPVIVFWRYAVYEQVAYYDYIGMFALALFLAYASWRFVEMPVRLSSFLTPLRAFVAAGAGVVLLVGINLVCIHQQGWPQTLHVAANTVMSGVAKSPSVFSIGSVAQRTMRIVDYFCGTDYEQRSVAKKRRWMIDAGIGSNEYLGSVGAPCVFLIGDSHAGSLEHGVDSTLAETKRAAYVVSTPGTAMFDLNDPRVRDALAKLDTLPSVKKVFLVQHWLENDGREPRPAIQTRAMLAEFAKEIRKRGKTLFIATDVPMYFSEIPLVDIRARMNIVAPRVVKTAWSQCGQTDDQYNRIQGQTNQMLAQVCRETGAVLIPLHLGLRKDGKYEYFTGQGQSLVSLYVDNNHLSMGGSLRVAKGAMAYLFSDQRVSSDAAKMTGPRTLCCQGGSAVLH
jgi:peptidoglycan/LPS O-acetylase OafA/YrhL